MPEKNHGKLLFLSNVKLLYSSSNNFNTRTQEKEKGDKLILTVQPSMKIVKIILTTYIKYWPFIYVVSSIFIYSSYDNVLSNDICFLYITIYLYIWTKHVKFRVLEMSINDEMVLDTNMGWWMFTELDSMHIYWLFLRDDTSVS